MNFHVFCSSTLIGKNISIRVERHKLLLCISKEQANEKDHYSIKSKKTQKTARATNMGVDKKIILTNICDEHKTYSRPNRGVAVTIGIFVALIYQYELANYHKQ